MVIPQTHCPHLGLKQNRAIRFASPTPEHRCFVTGDAQTIPVDQNDFCLSPNHVNCPLYMGSGVPSMADGPLDTDAVGPAQPSRGRGLRKWLVALPLRDRLIYGGLIAILLVIVSIYVIMGIQLLKKDSAAQVAPSPVGGGTPVSHLTATHPMDGTPPVTPTMRTPPPTTPTTPSTLSTPSTSTPTPTTATPTPTPSPLTMAPPTPSPSAGGTAAVSATAVLPSPTVATPPPVPTDTPVAPSPTTPVPTATETPLPTSTPGATLAPATPTPFPPLPTATQVPTPHLPPTIPPQPPAPSPTPQPVITREYLTLYFADATGSMLVPVTRLATIESKRVATAALRELAAGPQGNLQRLVPPDITILDIHRHEQTITVNFDRHPGSDLSLRSIALTLTEFAGVTEVRLQVQGTDLELDGQRGVFRRPVLNVDNPQGLPTDYTSGTRFLPLYFLQGSYYVRITRLVPRTTEVAEATVRELLAGPGSYRGHLFSPIPDGTQLIEVEKNENRSVVVNLTQAFVSAENREAALKVLALSLTELRDTSGRRIFTRVRVLVEGQRLAEFWGPEYDRLVERPSLNPQ